MSISERPQTYKEHYTDIGVRQIATWNDFFRPENSRSQRLVAVAKAASAGATAPKPFQLADVGCSKGMDTYSLAAAFSIAKVEARITAIDANPAALAKAGQPYAITPEAIAEKATRWRLPAAMVLGLFETAGPGRLKPVQTLRDMVSLQQGDIRYDRLEPGAYDAITANNVLSYYADGKPRRYLSSIVGNLADGLKPGGVLFINKYMDGLQPTLAEHGFRPLAELCDDPSGDTFYERETS